MSSAAKQPSSSTTKKEEKEEEKKPSVSIETMVFGCRLTKSTMLQGFEMPRAADGTPFFRWEINDQGKVSDWSQVCLVLV